MLKETIIRKYLNYLSSVLIHCEGLHHLVFQHPSLDQSLLILLLLSRGEVRCHLVEAELEQLHDSQHLPLPLWVRHQVHDLLRALRQQFRDLLRVDLDQSDSDWVEVIRT